MEMEMGGTGGGVGGGQEEKKIAKQHHFSLLGDISRYCICVSCL